MVVWWVWLVCVSPVVVVVVLVVVGRNRMGIGAVVGILFYLSAQIIFALGQLMQLSIPLVALAPTLIVLACALILLKRMRW